MQLTSPYSRRLQFAPAVFLSLLLLLSFFVPPTQAAEQNTAFVPFKINAPDQQEMTKLADETLRKELEAKKFTMLPRDEADKLVNYSGTWPPETKSLEQVAQKTGFDQIEHQSR